ncbi:MAG: hypothetical protein HOV97_05525 [Nonomuraea sp.]|nr:hypothetical protein [Nonomuraea sp.]
MMEAIRLHGTLRFVESEDLYSVYLDREDVEVYLAHGTGKVLAESIDEIDIAHEWDMWRLGGLPHDMYDRTFLDYLRTLVIDPDEVDDYRQCVDCGDPAHEDDLHGTNSSHGDVCESCFDDYWFCNDCEQAFGETTTTLNDTEVCERCRDRNWSWCDQCDGYHRDEDAREHDHGRQGCCSSPAQVFAIRNGDETLQNDVRTTVTLPAGIISDEGIGDIANYIRTFAYAVHNTDPELHQKLYSLSFNLSSLGPEWQTKKGNYTKRLSRLAYQEFGIKVQPEMLSQVGSIARDHSTAIDFDVAVTRDLNMGPEEFAHEESCWWQSYAYSRCTLKTNGGFGLRTFSEGYGGYPYVSGRAWVMPLKFGPGGLTPTFNAMSPDAFVVFNGYGDLSGYVPARMLAHMAGMTYRKITFECRPMYVNNDSGYLIAPEETAADFTDGCLDLELDDHSNLFDYEITVREPAHV